MENPRESTSSRNDTPKGDWIGLLAPLLQARVIKGRPFLSDFGAKETWMDMRKHGLTCHDVWNMDQDNIWCLLLAIHEGLGHGIVLSKRLESKQTFERIGIFAEMSSEPWEKLEQRSQKSTVFVI